MKTHRFIYLIGISGIVVNVLTLVSCTSIDKYMTQRAVNQIDQWSREAQIKREWEDKYIGNVIYVGMPEDEFVRLFTKRSFWGEEAQRPYITRRKKRETKNYYILSGLKSSYDYRVTFENRKLIKFEYHGHGSGGNPFGYNDVTFLLKDQPAK